MAKSDRLIVVILYTINDNLLLDIREIKQLPFLPKNETIELLLSSMVSK